MLPPLLSALKINLPSTRSSRARENERERDEGRWETEGRHRKRRGSAAVRGEKGGELREKELDIMQWWRRGNEFRFKTPHLFDEIQSEIIPRN